MTSCYPKYLGGKHLRGHFYCPDFFIICFLFCFSFMYFASVKCILVGGERYSLNSSVKRQNAAQSSFCAHSLKVKIINNFLPPLRSTHVARYHATHPRQNREAASRPRVLSYSVCDPGVWKYVSFNRFSPLWQGAVHIIL